MDETYDRVCMYSPLVPPELLCFGKVAPEDQSDYRLQHGPITMVTVYYSPTDGCIKGESPNVDACMELPP